jgi:hypothetical protein
MAVTTPRSNFSRCRFAGRFSQSGGRNRVQMPAVYRRTLALRGSLGIQPRDPILQWDSLGPALEIGLLVLSANIRWSCDHPYQAHSVNAYEKDIVGQHAK